TEDTPVEIEVPVGSEPGVGFSLTTPPLHGDLSGAGPTYTYTPHSDFHGSDELVLLVQRGAEQASVTVSVDVSPVNDPPSAGADASSTAFNVPRSIGFASLLTNDADVEGDGLAITGVAAGAHAAVALDAEGVLFTPEADFAGEATFTYT